MPQSLDTVENLVVRMKEFRGTLPAGEQQALDQLLSAAYSGFSTKSTELAPKGLLPPDKDAIASFVNEVDSVKAKVGSAPKDEVAWITITTTITITASHPIIGCHVY